MEIKFHEITIQDKEWMDQKFEEDDSNACEHVFANNFIWRKIYNVEVAEISGCAVIRFCENGNCQYSYPIGAGDKRAAVEQLQHASREAGRTLRMSPLLAEDREQLLEWFPGQFLVEGERDAYDYIYSREKLATLAGKKLHGKRNHIARFKDGADWSYEPMTKENLEECREMTYKWMHMRSEKWNQEMENEVIVLHEAFDHMGELGLSGGVLRKKEEIVAFCVGEPLNSDTFVVHFEKAFPDMQGAYPMINQQFVINECSGYTYVNREDDTGDMGLRKAKLSYYPEILLKKYAAEESTVVFADPKRDREQISKIWRTCFGDEEEYISFYLEHRMTEDNMLVIYRDGRAVSMASFLPVEYGSEGTYLSARYVYAVATLPEYRGQGMAGKILEFAEQKFGEPLVLAPAEESLCRYYEKRGFFRAFSGQRQKIDGEIQAMELKAEQAIRLEPVTPEEYKKIRDERFGGEGYVRWDEEAIRYAIEQNSLTGGRTYVAVEETGEKELLMYQKEGDTLRILETTLLKEQLAAVLPTLIEELGAKEAIYDRMQGMLWFPSSLRQSELPKDGYLNLTLG